MDYNFHTHTYFCNHASGTMEEYVLKAIEGGLGVYGFSDHAPFKFPDGHNYNFRVPLDKVSEYKKSVFDLREKYKDKIKIFYGFEMEYYPIYFEDMLKIVKDAGAEYLILGQHFLFNEIKKGDAEISAFRKVPTEEELVHFSDCVVSAIKSGVFTYVAHPDTVDFDDFEIYKREAERICIASKECDVPLEINFQGIRENRPYPKEKFWQIAGEIGCPVTFGFDSHQIHAACDLESEEKALQMVEKFNLNYIGMPKLKSL